LPVTQLSARIGLQLELVLPTAAPQFISVLPAWQFGPLQHPCSRAARGSSSGRRLLRTTRPRQKAAAARFVARFPHSPATPWLEDVATR
jgi:hypothetical protein